MTTTIPALPKDPAIRRQLREQVCIAAARKTLLDFTRYTYEAYRVDKAHQLISDTLDRVVSGEIKRLMVFAPPQHGKSELASVRLPAYWLGQRPDDPVILTSYGAALAHDKSRQVRTIVESDDYRRVFPAIATRRDSRAVDLWEIKNHRGSLRAAGVDGPITGRGGLLGIIDDPLEGWTQAQSQTIRDHCYDWYRGTFRNRIWEHGAIVIIMTRWHEDDLCGRLLREQPGEWTVLRLPALAETQDERDFRNKKLGLKVGRADPLGRSPGEALCPRRYSRKALLELQRDSGSLVWSALYQGFPTASEGNRFKRDWWRFIDSLPEDANQWTWCRYWDKAGTHGGGKYSCGSLMGRTPDGSYVLANVHRGQWSAMQREQEILKTATSDRAWVGCRWIAHEQEPGSGGKQSAEATTRMLAGFNAEADRVTGSKEVRAEPYAAQVEAGNVYLLRGSWNQPYIDEMAAFPNGAFTDQADSSAGSFMKLALAPRTGIGVFML